MFFVDAVAFVNGLQRWGWYVWFTFTRAVSFLQVEESEASSMSRRQCLQRYNEWPVCFITNNNRKMNQVIPGCPKKILNLILAMWSWLYFCVANLLWENREKRVFGQAAVWRTAPVYHGADQEVMKKGEVLPVKKRDIFRRSRWADQWSPWEQTRLVWVMWWGEISGWLSWSDLLFQAKEWTGHLKRC